MAALIAPAAVRLAAAGVITGIVGLVAVAIRREETTSPRPVDNRQLEQAGRWGCTFADPTAPPLLTGRRHLSSPPAGQPGDQRNQFTELASPPQAEIH